MSGQGRELLTFGAGRSHVSQTALVQTLQGVRERGLPEHSSRRTLKRAALCGVKFFPILNPCAHLCNAMRESPGLQELVKAQLRKLPCTTARPWRLVVYSDEVVLGNVLAHANKRKMFTIYWSFMELSEGLRTECLWFNILTIRSCQLPDIQSGVSQVAQATVAAFFREPYAR